ncbi:MAG: protoporphyrinogen oxidase [Desulfuromonadales bacterium GWD2_61_12]|nr:MAG: protoporphyrinogen oxidase [Desulfuromonadales bacterium GWC2_61_20]OGR33699.1 MAG: protoporphyrinogen oxidase [Desulfuromonadales bacterium GWD2_61_12]HAD03246.1 protoporphyrinogen oxidase [Desulfuromonas sp.]
MTRVAIIGAGISGLAAAHAIEREAAAAGITLEVVVLERDKRIGGKIWSIKEEGYLCEWGPNGFLDNKPMTLELCDRLDISDRLLRSDDNARKRYICSAGELHRLPENGPMFLRSKLLSWPGKLRIAREMLIPPLTKDVDETLAEFARRRLGPEALDKLIGPMVSGIFAGDPETMSVASCFPRIVQLEQEYGGLIRAMVKLARQKRAERKAGKAVASAAGPGGTLTSFLAGIQELTDATAAAMGGTVRTGAGVTAIVRRGEGFEVKLEDGSTLDADVVVSAAPAYALAGMVAGLDPALAGVLREIRYAPMNVVCFGYARDKIAHPLDGFGYLITRQEKRQILGTLWDSSIFPNRAPQGSVLLRSMMGGATNPGAFDLAESEVKARVQGDLKAIMGINADPDFVRIFRHREAIPQYTVGHSRHLIEIAGHLEATPGLFVAGNAFFGVGLNDCVNASNQVAERVVALLHNRNI